MKCWWCDDDISNTVAHIKTHCKDNNNVTECNNVIMQKVCTLMRNPNLLKRSMNSSAKLCYICGLFNEEPVDMYKPLFKTSCWNRYTFI